MVERIFHQYEQYSGFMSVAVSFTISAADFTNTDIIRAMLWTTSEHTILRCCISCIPLNIGVESTSTGLAFVTMEDISALLSKDDHFVKWSEVETPAPDANERYKQLENEARKPIDKSKGLFRLIAVKYSDKYVFHLVIDHGASDGASIFCVVKTFCENLSYLLEQALHNNNTPLDDDEFTSLLSARPVTPIRDMVSELLQHPLAVGAPEHPLFGADHSNILKLPALTEDNSDAMHSGCVRLIVHEFDTKVTSRVLDTCRAHGVSFQALLSTAAALAMLKLLHLSGELKEDKWNAPAMQMCPINMRRFLSRREKDVVSASLSLGLYWEQSPFLSYESLSQRLFWSDLVMRGSHQPIKECINSSFPFQNMARMESGVGSPPFSLLSSSIGAIKLKERYGNLHLQDVTFMASFLSTDWAAYDCPAVPEASLNNETPGILMLHAYTVFDQMKLSCEYYGYSTAFATMYYDEIIRIIKFVGAAEEEEAETGSDSVTVGDVFVL